MAPTPRPVLPVITVVGVDDVARASAVAGLLWDAPQALALQYDVRACPHDPEAAVLHRTLLAGRGVLERHEVPLTHGCMSCAMNEDVLPTLQLLAERGTALVVLVLPVAAEPLPVVRAMQAQPWGLRVGAVVTAVAGDSVVHDLLGDDTLAERGRVLFPGDDRAVGEALCHQVEYSDLIAVSGVLGAPAAELLQHLAVRPHRIRTASVHELVPDRLATQLRPTRDPRGDLLAVDVHHDLREECGVWTVDLRAERPVHPDRLLARIEALGSGRLRSRGHVWLASRPEVAVAWDGSGGQLSVGSLGPWSRGRAATRIVVTGVESADRQRVLEAFEGLQLSADEHARGSHWWVARGDQLDPWLGSLADCA